MSVLGKRSRSTRSGTSTTSDSSTLTSSRSTCLPPRKKVKQTEPEIFEDESSSSSVGKSPIKSPSQRSSSTLTKKAPNARSRSQRVVTKVAQLDASRLIDEQDENCMPVEMVVSTPSAARFKNVLTECPTTPKCIVRMAGGLLTPRTPRTFDALARREQSIYAKAKQLFCPSVAPTKLIGRDSERQQLKNFMEATTISQHGRCTYISGPPGTGKSALVREILQEYTNHASVRMSTINCVSLRTATQVFDKLLDDFVAERSASLSASCQLKRIFSQKDSPIKYVVMLDEIDSLIDAECEILYTLFTWALQPRSCLSLIGIANALDLTDRCLPKLKARGLKPEVLAFMPYNAQQISQIITDKLRTLLSNDAMPNESRSIPCMQPMAIQLCGKKIASQTGDLRKAFSLVRKCLEQVEKEAISRDLPVSASPKILAEVTNTSIHSPPSRSCPLSWTAETAPRVTIAHVAKIAASIFQDSASSRIGCLNLQQKAVLCSIINREVRQQRRNPFITPTKSATKLPTVGELYYKYSMLCKRDDGILHPLKDTEFRDVVASLETLGLVYDSKSRSSSLLTPSSSSRGSKSHDGRQMISVVTEAEMRSSLIGPGADLLARLLDEM